MTNQTNVDGASIQSIVTLPESSERWLKRRLEKRLRVMSFKELCDEVDDTPEFWTDDIDEAYREGFEEGFDYCIQRFEELYRKRGFVRVQEIANILLNWSENVLRPWRYWGKGKHKDDMLHYPLHEQKESWSEIRERILRRDKKCVRCGDVVRMEVDHIVEVQNGGIPTDDNLRALCAVCHKGKRIWST